MTISMTARKVKVSVTLSADLLEHIDQRVQCEPGASRSSVMEAWLRRAVRRAAADELQAQTIAYYEGLSAAEIDDDRRWARGATAAARRLRVDE